MFISVNKRELADDEDLSYLNELIASSSESEDNHEEESLQEVAKKKVMFICSFIQYVE